LQVDHVKPVASEGKNDILNLTTSCKPCNAEKGKRLLNEKTTITKQLDQLKEINERHEQLDMMIHWKEDLWQNWRAWLVCRSWQTAHLSVA
jgi:HNH endonuclease